MAEISQHAVIVHMIYYLFMVQNRLFKVIQGYGFWSQWKACVQLFIH